MSAEIVNLRKARKARDRVAKEQRATENRAKFGRTKAERKREQAEDALHARRLEALKREGGQDGDGGGDSGASS